MLRTRLFLNLLPFVVLLLAIGVFSIVLFSRLATGVERTVADNYNSVIAAEEMSLALAGMELEMPWVLGSERVPDSKAFAINKARFEEHLARQLDSIALPGEEELTRQLATNYHAYQAAMTNFAVLQGAGAQRQLYAREIGPRGERMKQLLAGIRDINHEAITGTSDYIRSINRDVTLMMVAGLAISLVVSAYACYRIGRSVLEPILSMTQATRALGEGVRGDEVPVSSNDELGELAGAFNKMAAQLHEYRQSTSEKIVRLHRTMETTLASFPDPIFVLDGEGRIELKNPAAEGLMAGLHLHNALPPRLAVIAAKVVESSEDFLPDSFNEALSFRLGDADRYYLPRILAMRTKEDARLGVAIVLYDVTRFRLLDSVKTNLVATVSHELKTPLTSVRMVLHLLLERTVGALSPKQDELLTTARNDTERLLRILNNLLDLARLEEGIAGLRREKVFPAELIQRVMEETSSKVEAKGLILRCSVAPDLPAVSVDQQRIEHVFTNLISNAIKHSRRGGEIVLEANRSEDGEVEFGVLDQGPGVPEEYRALIFDRFFRVPGQTNPGAGLGLSIAKEIVVAHGGRIGVRSAPDGGSRFFVILGGT